MNGKRTGRTIVTGAAGLIGSALVWELNRHGIEDAIVVDRLARSDKWRHLVPLRFSEYLEAEEFYPRILENPGAFGPIAEVYHLGACSATTERDATYLIANNYRTTQDLSTWALGRDARFVYASSAATYGSRETDLREDLDPYSLAPLNMYGYSKHLFDLWARREGILDRMVGLKFFNVYGPNEDHKGDMRSVVAKAYEQITADGAVKLFESYRPGIRDGEQTRDFLYVKDAVAVTLHLGRSATARGLYNVGSGVARTWNDLATAIFTALERPKNITYIPMPDALRGKYQYRTEATIDKLRASGYDAPFTSLEEGVWEYICRYLIPGQTLGTELPTLSQPAQSSRAQAESSRA
jgi:ADP-L-glycero-D-manno-heptose 6-epimerase